MNRETSVRSEVLATRVTLHERQYVQAKAAILGVTVAEFLRDIAMGELRKAAADAPTEGDGENDGA